MPVEYWDSFLYENVRTANLPMIKRSLNSGADVNCLSFDDNTPLANATKRGRIDIMQLLLAHRADRLKCGPKGRSPMSWAIYRNHLQALQLLLKGKINQVDEKGNTALLYAVQENKHLICDYLVNNGASVNQANAQGAVPLHEASRLGNLNIVKLLLAKGAQINRLGPDGNTPVAVAAKNGHSEVVKLLTMKEADLGKVGEGGKSALAWGVTNEDCDLVEFLAENGGGVQAAFVEAVEGGSLEMVKFLHEQGGVVDEELLKRSQNVDIVNYLGGEDSDDSFVYVDKNEIC